MTRKAKSADPIQRCIWCTLITAVALSLTIALFINKCLITHPASSLIVTPTGTSGKAASEGTGVSVHKIVVDGVYYQVEDIFEATNWIYEKRKGVLSWNSYTPGLDGSLIGRIPEGRNRAIILNTSRWSGDVRLETGGQDQIIRLYSPRTYLPNAFNLDTFWTATILRHFLFLLPITLLLCLYFYRGLTEFYKYLVKTLSAPVKNSGPPLKFTFFCFVAGGLICCSQYVMPHFAAEAYERFMAIDSASGDIEGLISWHIYDDPRLLLALFYKLCHITDFNPILPANQPIVAILALILQSVSCQVSFYYLYQRSIKLGSLSVGNFFILASATFIFWFNPFWLNMFQYIETMPIVFVGNLGAILAAVVISNTNLNGLYRFFWGSILLLIPTNIYQVPLQLYVAFAMLYYLMDYVEREENAHQPYPGLAELALRILPYGISSLYTLALFETVSHFKPDSLRGNMGEIDFFANLMHVIQNQRYLWIETLGLFPRYWLLVCLMIMLGLLLYHLLMIFRSGASRNGFKLLSVITLVFLGALVGLFIFDLVEIWPWDWGFGSRRMPLFPALPGLLAIVIVVLNQAFRSLPATSSGTSDVALDFKATTLTASLIMAFLLIVNCGLLIRTGSTLMASNVLDKFITHFYGSSGKCVPGLMNGQDA